MCQVPEMWLVAMTGTHRVAAKFIEQILLPSWRDGVGMALRMPGLGSLLEAGQSIREKQETSSYC